MFAESAATDTLEPDKADRPSSEPTSGAAQTTGQSVSTKAVKIPFFSRVKAHFTNWLQRRKSRKSSGHRMVISEPTFIGKTALDYTQLQNGLIPSGTASAGTTIFVPGLSDNPAYGPHVSPRKRHITPADIKRLPDEGPRENLGDSKKNPPLIPV